MFNNKHRFIALALCLFYTTASAQVPITGAGRTGNSIPAVPTTWNPSDLSNVTLSSGNLVATVGSGPGGVRGILSKTAGKVYCEYTYTTINTNSFDVGIALATASLTLVSQVGTAFTARISGNIFVNGVDSGSSIGLITTGTVVGMAVDFTNQLIWFRAGAGGSWNGSGADPATGTGGVSIAIVSTGALFPFMTGQTGDKVTANFGATAFSGTVPSGYSSGWK